MGLRCAAEAFADRAYESDGKLRSRSLQGSLIEDPSSAAEQAVSIAVEHKVRTVAGTFLKIIAETLCIHSDTPGALEIARELNLRLTAAGVRLRALSEVSS